jgi:hypothetical protein
MDFGQFASDLPKSLGEIIFSGFYLSAILMALAYWLLHKPGDEAPSAPNQNRHHDNGGGLSQSDTSVTSFRETH